MRFTRSSMLNQKPHLCLCVCVCALRLLNFNCKADVYKSLLVMQLTRNADILFEPAQNK